MRILKMLLRLVLLPLLVVSLLVHVLLALIIGLSSIVTNLIGTLFIFGSIAGWIIHAAPTMVWQTVCIGIFFFLAPHIASWLNEKASGIAGSIFVFLIGW